MRKLCAGLGMLMMAAAAPPVSAESNCEGCTHTQAFETARVHGGQPQRGVILHLHGCGGLELGAGGWQKAWLDYLTGQGFTVVTPDSFADVRPPAACPGRGAWTPTSKNLIFSHRIQQTEYAVEQLRKKYPGRPLYLWGHAEGGRAATMITADIDGIISTGAACPDEWLDGIADTPLLVIQGTDDPHLQEAKNNPLYGSLEGRCQMQMTEPKWEWLIVKGMKHAAPLASPGVKARVAKFLGLPGAR
ncbi:MAG: hypothetical protein OXR84_11395 [Magnetovibrio sp.]|nr:hypothetical protein [Magnetovibrio sp.]